MQDHPETEAQDAGGNMPAVQEAAEQIPAPSFIRVMPGALIAALSCASTEESRYYLCGVFVHRVKEAIRLVATDGHRLLIQQHGAPIEGEAADWLDDGVIVSAEGLKARLKLFDAERPIKIGFAKGSPFVTLCDEAGLISFRVGAVDGHYPDYNAVVKSATGAFVGEIDRLKPAPFATQYVKAVGELGKLLEAESVQFFQPAYASGAEGKSGAWDGPAVVTFAGAAHALLYLMPVQREAGFSASQVAILNPALKASVAALRAHETRNRQDAKKAKDAKVKASAILKADAFKARIEELLATTRAALPAPAKPEPIAPTPQPEAPAPESVPPIAEAIEAAPAAEKPKRKREKKPEVSRGVRIKRARKARGNGRAEAHA